MFVDVSGGSANGFPVGNGSGNSGCRERDHAGMAADCSLLLFAAGETELTDKCDAAGGHHSEKDSAQSVKDQMFAKEDHVVVKHTGHHREEDAHPYRSGSVLHVQDEAAACKVAVQPQEGKTGAKESDEEINDHSDFHIYTHPLQEISELKLTEHSFYLYYTLFFSKNQGVLTKFFRKI